MKASKYSLHDQDGNRKFLYKTEIDLLIEVAEAGRKFKLRNSSLVLTAFRHAFRVSELCNLQWRDISFSEKKMFVRRSKDGVSNYQAIEGEECDRLRQLKDIARSEYVFSSERGGKLARGAVSKLLERLGAAAKLDLQVHPHMLRHACGYYMASQGLPLYVIQNQLGHKCPSNTLIYVNAAGLPPATIDWNL